ncbi:MAG: hypothetical protein PF569_03060 [Candidatus Woesearchaeota archaeon]|jgi:hypothetical protein|nr:hypothetical protein [Candidatus Woesearchaeota archaeon]
MLFMILFLVFLGLLFSYFFYTGYFFQFILHKYRVKNSFIEEFNKNVKGRYASTSYFGNSHKLVSKAEFHSFSNKHKINFSMCHNIVRFKTADSEWEIFFNLIKEGVGFREVFNLRVFPRSHLIKSEGNVEKNYSRLNVFTNNSYLTKILEKDTIDNLKWLIRYNGDILLISPNNLHFKAFLDSQKLNVGRVMDMVKAMNNINSSIYKEDVIEY